MQPNAPRNRGPQAVQVSRNALWALAATALAFALATAYLLGRLSAGAPQPVPASSNASAAAPPATELPATPEPPALASGAPEALVPTAGAATWSESAPADAASSSAPPSADVDRERQQVRHYFAALDGLLQGQSFSGDPQALAQQLVQQTLGGDPSGLEALVATQQEATRALRGLEPPAPCVEHHRRTLALAEKTLTLVQQVQAGLAGGDSSRLLELASLGREAEQEARELQALDRQLRQTWGVPTPP